MFCRQLRGHVKQRSGAFTASNIIAIATDDKWSPFPVFSVKRASSCPHSSRSLYVSLTASPWNPWINNSRHRFFTLWLNMIFIPFSILLPTQLCEEAHKTLFISSPESHLRYIYIFFFLPPTTLGSSLEPPKCCLSTTWLALFSPKYPSTVPLPLSLRLFPLIPPSRHCAVNLRQWQTLTRKPAISIPLCISITEQLDMKALLSGPSWLTVRRVPSVNRETEGKKWGNTTSGKKRRRGLQFSYRSNGINGRAGLKLAFDDCKGLAVFLSVIGRFPLLLSLFLSVSLPSLTFFTPLSV